MRSQKNFSSFIADVIKLEICSFINYATYRSERNSGPHNRYVVKISILGFRDTKDLDGENSLFISE